MRLVSLLFAGLVACSPIANSEASVFSSQCNQVGTINLTDSLIVDTTLFNNWNSVLNSVTSNGVSTILLKPGDYRSWGALNVFGLDNKTLRYYDPDSGTTNFHPTTRTEQAIIHGILLMSQSDNWTVHGITITEPDVTVANGLFHILTGSHNTFDSVLVENVSTNLGIRIRDGVGNCVINSTIRNSFSDIDSVGIQIKPYQTGSTDVIIFNNEIYNWIDGIQTTVQSGLPVNFTIENNHIYSTSDKYVYKNGKTYSCTENGIDIKVANPAVRSYIRNNSIHGFRETPLPEDWYLCGSDFTSGGAGDAIVMHMESDNVEISGNSVGDSIHGFRNSNKIGGRHTSIFNNFFYNIPANNSSVRYYDGAVLVLEDNTLVYNNRFSYTAQICPATPWPPAGFNPSGPVLVNNTYTGDYVMGSCTEN